MDVQWVYPRNVRFCIYKFAIIATPIRGSERRDFRKVPRLKKILGPENLIVSACMEEISEHLNEVVRASKVTTLPFDWDWNWAIQNIGFLIDI
jgi:hypothetical protein